MPSAALAGALLAWLTAVCLGVGLHFSGALTGPEAALLDIWMGLRRPVPVDPRILLVEVDAGVGARLGKPTVLWTGDYARAIQALLEHGATAVGLDLILHARREGLPLDSPILAALEEGELALGLEVLGGRVVLGEYYGPPVSGGPDASAERRSVPTLHYAAEPLGNTAFLNVATDPDRTVRCVPLFWSTGPVGRTRTLAGRLAELTLDGEMTLRRGQVTLAGADVVTEGQGTLLRFQDPGPGFPRLPLSQILDRLDRGEVLPDLRGRVCLVGPGFDEASDLHRTPRDWRGGPLSLTPGMQIHAAALNTCWIRPKSRRWLESGQGGRAGTA